MYFALDFWELKSFERTWKDLRLTDEDLFALQHQIMFRPDRAPVVSGTGGLRKLRFAPSSWRAGKSGSIRVGYLYLEAHAAVVLVIAYGKKQKDDLSSKEKAEIAALVDRIRKEFAKRKPINGRQT